MLMLKLKASQTFPASAGKMSLETKCLIPMEPTLLSLRQCRALEKFRHSRRASPACQLPQHLLHQRSHQGLRQHENAAVLPVLNYLAQPLGSPSARDSQFTTALLLPRGRTREKEAALPLLQGRLWEASDNRRSHIPSISDRRVQTPKSAAITTWNRVNFSLKILREMRIPSLWQKGLRNLNRATRILPLRRYLRTLRSELMVFHHPPRPYSQDRKGLVRRNGATCLPSSRQREAQQCESIEVPELEAPAELCAPHAPLQVVGQVEGHG